MYASSYRMRRRKPNSAAAGTTEDQNYSHFEGSSEVSVSMKIHGTLGAPSVKVGGRAGCPSPSRRSLSLFRSPRRSLSLPLSPFSSLSFSLPLLLALSPSFSGCAPQSLSHVAGPARLWQRVERMGCELELPTCPRSRSTGTCNVAEEEGKSTGGGGWWAGDCVVTLRVAIYSACVLLVSPHDSDRR